MNKWKPFAAVVLSTAVLSTAVLAPSLAGAADLGLSPRHHRYAGYHYWYGLPYPISYLHNYGPGYVAGTFAYYDGPSNNYCYQGSAAYIGQDGRRHPCF
jgi:hypothetical protein